MAVVTGSTATMFLLRHSKKIIAVIVVLLLFLAFLMDQENANDCLPASGSSTGGSGASGVVNAEGLAYPTDPSVTQYSSGFGPRGGEFHQGQDIAGPLGTPVYAFADGTVVAAADSGVQGFGGWVVITHQIDGKEMSTVSGHMDPGGVMVSVGDQVKAGQQIARIGNSGFSSGPHLHFELHNGNRLTGGEAIDPKPTLDKVLAGGGEKAEAKPAESTEATPGAGEAGQQDQSGSVEDQRARQIIDGGKTAGVDETTIIAALSAAQVEAGMRNLASEAVPESKNYANDGVAPGDADSVGLFQQRVSVWGPQAGGVAGLMDVTQQVNWFYTQAKTAGGSTPGEIAANVESPAPENRGKYAAVEDKARDFYNRLEHGATGALADAPGTCGTSGTPGGGIPGDARGIGRAILAAAREQFGATYVWGGGDQNGPTGGGFDCSGLTLYAVAQATKGELVMLHQTNSQMIDPGLEKVSWEDRQPGDLLYFGSPVDYHHVSIYSGDRDGTAMQYEAQDFGVPLGEYPVRFGEDIQVRRVKTTGGEAAEETTHRDNDTEK